MNVNHLVNGLITVGDRVMISEQEIFSMLARLSWDVKSQVHYVRHMRWIKTQVMQHHPFGWEVGVIVWLAGGSKDIVMGASRKGGEGRFPLDL